MTCTGNFCMMAVLTTVKIDPSTEPPSPLDTTPELELLEIKLVLSFVIELSAGVNATPVP